MLVRSHDVGICHSDFELYEGRYIIPVSYPIVPGHEWCGEIAEVGAVYGLSPGDGVVGDVSSTTATITSGSRSGADAEYFVAEVLASPDSRRALLRAGRLRGAVFRRVQRVRGR